MFKPCFHKQGFSVILVFMIKAQIQDKELSEYLQVLQNDEMIHFTMADGRIRGALFHGTHFVNQMRAQHNTGILETYILGQACLCGALLIPALMKGREHVSWRYDVETSLAKGFSVEADSTGWVRGYLLTDHIPVDKPLENWDMTPFLAGDGFMTIQTAHPGDKYPQTSSVNTTGNIADDLVFFFDRSEQLKTALTTSIQMDKKGRVVGAGGIFIQVMPETGGHYNGKEKLGAQINTASNQEQNEILIEEIENVYRAAPSLGTWFSQGHSHEEFLQKNFGAFNPIVAVHRDIIYDCPCSKDFFVRFLKGMSEKDKADLKNKNETLELRCQNCGSVYHVEPTEF